MSDTNDESDTVVNRRQFLTVAGASGIATLAGCGGETTDDQPATTSTSTDRSTDTPTERSPTDTTTELSTEADTETETETEAETEAETETETETTTPDPEVSQSEPGPLAPLPTPEPNGVSKPDGEPGNLTVLEWAGFDGAVTYTFDDGQPSNLEHYDALAATEMNMTFFITSNVGFDGFEDGWKAVAADGHELGNHTVSHPYADMTGSSFGDAVDDPATEIEQCSSYITENLGQEGVWTMAAPFGDDGWADPAAASDLFLSRGVGGGAVAPDGDADPYNLPCYMAQEGDTAETFTGLIDDAREAGTWQIFLFHTISPTDEVWYAPVDIGAITDSVEHAKSAGDVWIDTFATIGAYWRGQQILESADVTESDDETVWEWTVPEDFPAGRRVRVTVDGGTLSQNGEELEWNSHGYYEVALDEESLTLSA
ncbi:chitin deacetylase protein [Halorhabdus tiamatea SARL4B]|uniref:Chitin deacetylase protein n=1 Tax=Halorhabdus tiamatea SARL4B TaxID=1033806 RepID=F7PQ76_9EURY|nr:polysaccharide deacetylase family protein [Halorhabdus tiamatea]ERJ05048.1 chitin deacetylase protein [Halorhabdus tiamatea SARL4B]CCQ33084.1 polysaccharide deacetylase [Halorhabdus tiamatea SARL4B]